jgi:radical SAM superfamily enzyme YgiQ (UPF0313 family)
MTPGRLCVNPALTVLPMRGALVAAQLTGSAPMVRLEPVDLALLHLFLPGRTPEEVVKELITGPTRTWVGHTSAGWVRERVRQLAQAAVLIAAPDAAEVLTDGEPNAPASGLSPITPLRVARNLALRPGPHGFEAWSPRTRSRHRLSLDLVLLLQTFTTERTPDPASPAEALSWLLDHGLLVDAARWPITPPWASPTVALPAAPERGWRALEPDGRIPVYFVPHLGSDAVPLALGMIAAAITAHQDGALLERFQLLPLSGTTAEELLYEALPRFGPGVWLFSDYVWSVRANLELSAAVRALSPGSLVVHGGPSVPGYPDPCRDFLLNNPSIDVLVHGEGELTAAELLGCVGRDDQGLLAPPSALQQVHGLSFRRDGRGGVDLITTAPRERLADLDRIPSPYLTGLLDGFAGATEAIVETNRGCPFGCTFCDWGSATRQKVRKFDLDRVKAEIEHVGRSRCRVLWIADANFGMYDRDIELAAFIVDVRRRHGFPREVAVNYTKNTTRRLVEIIRLFTEGGVLSQGIVSIQTTDPTTLAIIDRSNIRLHAYEELAAAFAAHGLPLSTDLMIGLPGITPAAFDRDLQRCFDVDVTAKAYPTQVLPNSPMADPAYRNRHGIEVDEHDLITSCHSFTAAELWRMRAIYNVYTVAEGYGTLRYVLRYLQWEHDLPALTFLHAVLDALIATPREHPALTWAMSHLQTERRLPGGWSAFYEEVAAVIARQGVPTDSALHAVLAFNEAVMPEDGLVWPRTVELPHDVLGWFKDHRETPRPLRSYGPGRVTVDDPEALASLDLDQVRYDAHQYFWELRTEVGRARSSLAGQ